MTLDGKWPDGAATEKLFVTEDSAPALRPVTCALAPDMATGGALIWFQNWERTPVITCEKSPRTVEAILKRTTLEKSDWHMAYLAEAETDKFPTVTKVTFEALKSNTP